MADMEKTIRIIKKGEDESNVEYWSSLPEGKRMEELEQLRQEVNLRLYGAEQRFQRVYRVVKRS